MSVTKYNHARFMWYLIIPPIIVVLSLSFILWYLSRKGADPFVAEKATRLAEDAQTEISFLRTKNFFLRVLEKTAYRFKVISLRTHNGLNDLTQAIKIRRQRFQEEVMMKRSLEEAKASLPEKATARNGFFKRLVKNDAEETNIPKQEDPTGEPVSTEVVLEQPIFRRVKPVETHDEKQMLSAFRPTVSETLTRPEVPVRIKTQADIAREEDLIARIAVNPKDFVAYEGLGDYYMEIGNVKDAKECYRQVLKLSPVQRMVKIKIRRLEKLLSGKAE